MTQPVRPEDLLPSSVDSGQINGVEVRKGSVAAFVANVKQLEQLDISSDEYAQVADQVKKLVPALRAVGVLDIFEPKTTTVAELIDSAPH